MKKALGLLGVFFLFLVGVFVALALFPPTGLAKRLLVGGTKHATGLELQINGPVKLRLVPSIDLQMEGVVVANPARTGAKPLVAAKSVQVTTGYTSFIGAVRTIDRIALTEPVIELETDAQGRNSWEAAAPVSRDPSARQTRAFAVAQVEIKGGTVDYRDQQSGLAARLERTEATLRDVTPERLGEALVKAGAAVLRQPSSGTTLEVADLDATARTIEPTRVRIGSMTAGGAVVRWRDAIQTGGVEATAAKVSADAVGLDGASTVQFSSANLAWRDPAGGGTVSASKLEGGAKAFKGGQLEALTFTSGDLSYSQKGGTKLVARGVSSDAKTASADGLSEVQFKSASATLEQPGTGTMLAENIAAAARRAQPSRLEGLALASSRIGVAQPTRAGGTATPPLAFELHQVSLLAPVLAAGTPVDATVASLHNKERVEGSIKLPSPEALTAGPSIPATISLMSSRGNLEFDGRIETGTTTSFKGRTRAETASVEALARWLGIPVPATMKGAMTVTGDIDAQGSRIALVDGRLAHGGNAMTGSVTVDLAGERPKVTGKVAADRLDADAYLGFAPISSPRPAGSTAPRPKPTTTAEVVEPEINLGDVFKSYVRGMLDAPPKRSGTLGFPELSGDDLIPAARRAKPRAESFAWSDDRLDLSALRSVDLDLDWSVKSLAVRGLELNAPQLRTQLDAGALTLDGRDVGTKDGRITGKAIVDARQDVPALSATVRGTGVDLRAVSEAFGIPAMVEGITSIEADVRTRGGSQKALVQGLTGKVKSEMLQGNVIGYDFGNISLAVILRWITGNREFDPERKTPISGLKADLDIQNGVVRDSTVTVGGPFLGVNAEGTIGLIEQRLDYHGRARIASIFSGLPFKLFGDWSRPSFQPDLSIASVFSRSAPGEPSLVDIVNAAEIEPDAELALMIGRLMQKAGPSGLDAGTTEFLQALQKKAIGN